jgi:hypothetical protein
VNDMATAATAESSLMSAIGCAAMSYTEGSRNDRGAEKFVWKPKQLPLRHYSRHFTPLGERTKTLPSV